MKTVTVDCAGLTQPRQLHESIAQALEFPQWYGHNLDALYDCLTETEATLHLLHFDAATFPGFQATFLDAAQENPRFTVTFY